MVTDRTELVEAALESLADGIALLGADGKLVFWNRAAEAIAGYTSVDLLSRPAPAALERLFSGALAGEGEAGAQAGHGALVNLEHKLGHSLTAMARMHALRDGMGRRIGSAVVFHPAESLDALPHGERGEASDVAANQAEFQERLEAVFEDFRQGGESFGAALDQRRSGLRAAQDARRWGVRGDAGQGRAGTGWRAAAFRGDGAVGRR